MQHIDTELLRSMINQLLHRIDEIDYRLQFAKDKFPKTIRLLALTRETLKLSLKSFEKEKWTRV